MKKLLPKTTHNPNGFTLVELLVVVAIIAILSVIGLAVFTGIQGRARDSKRKADIDEISKALEVHFANGSYPAVVGSWFANGATPANPTPNGAAYSGIPPAATTTYTVCATLEDATTYCRSNQQ